MSVKLQEQVDDKLEQAFQTLTGKAEECIAQVKSELASLKLSREPSMAHRPPSITLQPEYELGADFSQQTAWEPSMQQAALGAGQQCPNPPNVSQNPQGISTPPGFPPLAPAHSRGRAPLPNSSAAPIPPYQVATSPSP